MFKPLPATIFLFTVAVFYCLPALAQSNQKTFQANLTLTTLFELAEGLGVHPKKLIDIDFDD